MIECPCGSQTDYLACCGQYIENQGIPNTPERLMRSRYSAYSRANIDYIQKTMRGKPLEGFDATEAERWAKQVAWMGLHIVKTEMDPKNENIGYVEFIATYQVQGENQTIHELSQFQRHEGKWFYTDGTPLKTPSSSKKTKTSRNAPCPCGSQKKYKNCHGKK